MSKFIKKNLKTVYRYKEKDFNRENYLNLERHESTNELGKNVLNKIKKINFSKKIKLYPSLNDSYKLIAKEFNVSVKNILLTHGSDLAIKTIYETYLETGQSVILQKPCYAMTSVYANLFRAKIKYFGIKNDLKIDYSNLIRTLKSSKIKIIFIETPNGFTGQEVDKDQIIKILNYIKNKNILLVLDEAYFGFSKNSYVKLINKYKNLILTRTLSKAYGLAGLRIGFLIANAERILELNKFKPLHEISNISAEIARISILNNNKNLYEKNKRIMKYVKKISSDFGFEIKETSANFFLLKYSRRKQNKLVDELKRNKILIRRPYKLKILNDYIRISISSKKNINFLFKNIKKINNSL